MISYAKEKNGGEGKEARSNPAYFSCLLVAEEKPENPDTPESPDGERLRVNPAPALAPAPAPAPPAAMEDAAPAPPPRSEDTAEEPSVLAVDSPKGVVELGGGAVNARRAAGGGPWWQ